MKSIDDIDVLHKIRVKLYPNYFENVEGTYIARTDSDAALTVEEVCAELIKRGGYKGRFQDLVDAVDGYLSESAYLLCDGFAINTGYYTIAPGLGGTFESLAEVNDRSKHPINFCFKALARLRRLTEKITIEVGGIAENTAYIDEFFDVTSGTANEILTPGGMFIIRGHKIKIAGENSGAGIFLESNDEEKTRIKVTGSLAENTPSKIIGIVPQLEPQKSYRPVIVSLYSAGSSLLKQPRTIAGRSLLGVA